MSKNHKHVYDHRLLDRDSKILEDRPVCQCGEEKPKEGGEMVQCPNCDDSFEACKCPIPAEFNDWACISEHLGKIMPISLKLTPEELNYLSGILEGQTKRIKELESKLKDSADFCHGGVVMPSYTKLEEKLALEQKILSERASELAEVVMKNEELWTSLDKFNRRVCELEAKVKEQDEALKDYFKAVEKLSDEKMGLNAELKEARETIAGYASVYAKTHNELSTSIEDLEAEIERKDEALRKARGTLGYGPLDTMENTIKTVREILDEALSRNGEEA